VRLALCWALSLAAAGCQAVMSAGVDAVKLPVGAASPSTGGSRSVTTPNVLFMSRYEAEAALRLAGFERGVSVDDSSLCGSTVERKVVELGHVCHQAPAGGQPGSSSIPVILRVQTQNPYRGDLGNGRFWFLLPDFKGVPVDAARAKVRALGYTTKEVQIAYVDRPGCAPSTVCETVPEGLSRADSTSDMLFYAGRP